MRIFKWTFFVAIFLALTACSQTAENMRKKGDSVVLSHTIGRTYEKVSTSKHLVAGELLPQLAYGNRIGQTTLPSGDVIYKHATLREAGESSIDFGFIGSSKTKMEYAVYYFLVGGDGVVKDYANGIVDGGKVSCMEYVGGFIRSCGNSEQLNSDLGYVDSMMRTSNGQPVSVWQ